MTLGHIFTHKYTVTCNVMELMYFNQKKNIYNRNLLEALRKNV